MILERYIQREILEKLLWIILLLVLILTSHRFVDYLADAAAGKLPGSLLLNILLMKMLAVLPRLLPIAVFLAVILALTRLSGDREMIIMSVAGLSGRFHLRTVFRLSLIYALLVMLVSFVVSPRAEHEVQMLRIRAQVESDITGIASGRFKESSNGDRVVYVREFADGGRTMKDVFLQIRQAGRLGLLTSDSAVFEVDEKSGNRYIIFENGYRYIVTPGKLDYQISEYRKYAQLIVQGDASVSTGKLEAVPSIELFAAGNPQYMAELQWRLSYVIAAILLPLLAVVISRFSFGTNRYAALIICILVYFIYSNLLSISKTLMIREMLPAYTGLWWVHLLLAAAIVLLARYQEGYFQPRRRKRYAGVSAA
jgi:lipopolysaccharide export system permease protein